MAGQDWFEKDFYATLGVPKDADAAAVKKAYRKLARTLHPDRNGGNAASEKRFKEIGEAYAVLSDTEDRKQYDAIRSMSGGGARFTAGGPGGGPGGGAGFEDVFSSMFGGAGGAGPRGGGGRVRYSGGGGGAQPDLEDILGGMFGGAGGQGSAGFSGFRAPQGPQRGSDVNATTTIPFRDAVDGSTVTLSTADGERITTRIPAGVKDGQKIRLRGKGGQGHPGAPDGDLMLTVSVSPHPVFGRDGDNLTVDLPLTFAEASLGATVSVPTLVGKPVKVKIAPGTPAGRVLRVRGRGVEPRDRLAGDLLAKVVILVPQRLTDQAKAAIETLREQEKDVDPRAELFARAQES